MKRKLSVVSRKTITLLGLIIIISCGSFLFWQRQTFDPHVQAKTVTPRPGTITVPRPSHVVIVIEENHAYSEIIGSSSAPYINSLASQGAVLANSHAVTHPSEPNYLALFAGSIFGLSDDSCPHTFSTANLAQELIKVKDSFGGYSEDLPNIGSTICSAGNYARKHNPWVNFTNVPSRLNMPLARFPTNPIAYRSLPTLSIVIPNLQDDMHDGTVEQGDTWLKKHISGYVKWAKTNKSLLIVTWDEDDNSSANQIPTIFVGPMVKDGSYSVKVNHYNVLRTLEAMYGLPYANNSASVATITNIWQTNARV